MFLKIITTPCPDALFIRDGKKGHRERKQEKVQQREAIHKWLSLSHARKGCLKLKKTDVMSLYARTNKP